MTSYPLLPVGIATNNLTLGLNPFDDEDDEDDSNEIEVEMEECYYWQRVGFDAGLDWNKGHCYFFVLNKKGEIIAG